MSVVLLRVLVIAGVIVMSCGPVLAGRGGLAMDWLAQGGSRQAITVPAKDAGSAGAAAGAGVEVAAAGADIALGQAEAKDHDRRGAALGAAFNADLMSRRRERDAQDRRAIPTPWEPRFSGDAVTGLRDLIASVEAGRKGYDAIHNSAKALPSARPTDLTIAEINDWVSATPGQQHAIGRYQFIPKTLSMLVQRLNVPDDARFTPALQDRLADELLADAGLAEFRAGRLGRTDFMHSLAAIWAGLPTASGKSHYHGLAGNAAGMSWGDYDRQMAALFPVPVVFATAPPTPARR